MSLYAHGVRPLLYALCLGDTERVHNLVMTLLRRPQMAGIIQDVVGHDLDGPSLEQDIDGVHYPNPIGLAAGLDKQAIALPSLAAFQFGAITAGGVVPLSQEGNPRPRLFAYSRDKTLVNWMGLNSPGQNQVVQNIRDTPELQIPLGINLSVNKESASDPEKALADFELGLRAFFMLVQFIEINISSPNTAGLRDLINHLATILTQLHRVNTELAETFKVEPRTLFVKLSGDMPFELFRKAIEIVCSFPNSGLILINTTVSRGGLQTRNMPKQGGMSGPPGFGRAIERVRFARECHPTIPIVGVTGISNAQDTIEMLRVGANWVQLLTSFVMQSPFVVPQILRGVRQFMRQENMTNVNQFQRYWW